MPPGLARFSIISRRGAASARANSACWLWRSRGRNGRRAIPRAGCFDSDCQEDVALDLSPRRSESTESKPESPATGSGDDAAREGKEAPSFDLPPQTSRRTQACVAKTFVKASRHRPPIKQTSFSLKRLTYETQILISATWNPLSSACLRVLSSLTCLRGQPKMCGTCPALTF